SPDDPAAQPHRPRARTAASAPDPPRPADSAVSTPHCAATADAGPDTPCPCHPAPAHLRADTRRRSYPPPARLLLPIAVEHRDATGQADPPGAQPQKARADHASSIANGYGNDTPSAESGDHSPARR